MSDTARCTCITVCSSTLDTTDPLVFRGGATATHGKNDALPTVPFHSQHGHGDPKPMSLNQRVAYGPGQPGSPRSGLPAARPAPGSLPHPA